MIHTLIRQAYYLQGSLVSGRKSLFWMVKAHHWFLQRSWWNFSWLITNWGLWEPSRLEFYLPLRVNQVILYFFNPTGCEDLALENQGFVFIPLLIFRFWTFQIPIINFHSLFHHWSDNSCIIFDHMKVLFNSIWVMVVNLHSFQPSLSNFFNLWTW